MRSWVYFEPEYVCRRFNRLAHVYTLLDWLGLPMGMRRATVRAMQLHRGDSVLEVGCGTGRNFPLLLDAIGADGHLYGVDFAEQMLRRAHQLCEHRRWSNVTLLQSDATGYALPESVDAAVFSLSYATMKYHGQALEHAWNQLRPGGRLVIMDAKTPSGAWGKLVGPAMFWLSRASVLGNPDERPWEHLRAFTDQVNLEEKALGTYYICTAIKPADSSTVRSTA
jgi:demethylmenaquinone methyltransferase/2-methoxy-6-polyprenyl-1,4-benzoquinol methylase